MSHERESERGGAFTRRNFLYGAASTAALSLPLESPDAGARCRPSPGSVVPGRVAVTLRINGQAYALSIDSRTTLLDAIRDHAGLMGTKKGCGHGQCGACTVHLDGRRVLACLTFALMSTGHEVTTIEGLSAPGAPLHPMQQAFIDHDAFQCGYCTPGQIMSAVACVREGHAADVLQIREYMSGNICRCAAYPNIVAAIEQARTAS
jgi:xanthine dehydrogenase YagT iron-sulfur-binding subunit